MNSEQQFYDMGELDSVWQHTTNFDHLTYGQQRGAKYMQAAHEKIKDQGGEDLLRETYFGLYNWSSPLKGDAPEGLEPVHSLMGRAAQMPEFDTLRRSIKGDEVAAGIGCGKFVTDLMGALPEEVKEKMNGHQKAKKALQRLQATMAARQGQPGDASSLGMAAGDGQPGEGDDDLFGGEFMTDEKLRQAIEAARAKEAESAQEVQASMSQAQGRIDNSLSKSLKRAGQRIDQMRKTYQNMAWGSESGAKMQVGAAEGLDALIEYIGNNKNLMSLFDMLGWAKEMVEGELKKSVEGRDNLVDFRRGEFNGDMMAVDEFIALAVDAEHPLWLDFLSRFNDDISIKHFEGDEKAGKGPVIMVKDVSGSTMGEVFAMESALDFVLMQHMAKEKRRYCTIPFSGPGEFHVFDPGPNPLENLTGIIQHLKNAYFGGTEPYAPLTKAIDLICEDPSFKKGFILLLTDGSFSPPPPAFLKRLEEARKEPGLEIYAFVIGAHPGVVQTFTDRVIMLANAKDLKERGKIAEILPRIL